MSDKIKPHHLQRKAVLYVRQSSAHQVIHNRESRGLQYAMRERLTVLGWSDIEIIDDDLGISAAGTATRAGFERMVAEVCLGKVGAVAAREYHVLLATAAIGSNSSRCAALSTRYWSTKRPSTHRVKEMTGSCSG
jgi:Resolvase, N terminal domain